MKIQGLPALIVAVVAGLLIGAVLYGRPAAAKAPPKTPSVLRARALEIVDSRGRVRAALRSYADGSVVLKFSDANGLLRAKLGGGATGSGLVLADETTEPGIHILASRDGTWVSLQRGDQRRVITP
jgi:hypothetical protein